MVLLFVYGYCLFENASSILDTGGGYFGALLTYVLGVVAYIGLESLGLKNVAVYYMTHYETLFSFIISLLLFMAFKNVDIGKCRIVNLFGESTFAVYLIHAMPSLFSTLWNGIFSVNEHLDSPLYIIIVIVTIFVVAIAAETIRRALFNKFIYTTRGYRGICKKIDEFYWT